MVTKDFFGRYSFFGVSEFRFFWFEKFFIIHLDLLEPWEGVVLFVQFFLFLTWSFLPLRRFFSVVFVYLVFLFALRFVFGLEVLFNLCFRMFFLPWSVVFVGKFSFWPWEGVVFVFRCFFLTLRRCCFFKFFWGAEGLESWVFSQVSCLLFFCLGIFSSTWKVVCILVGQFS